MKIGQGLAYAVAGTSVASGILVSTGMLFEDLPHLPRILLGIVLILMGIHRYATSRTKAMERTHDRA